jgi:hypothetical protein
MVSWPLTAVWIIRCPTRRQGRPAAPRRSNGRLPSALASQLCLGGGERPPQASPVESHDGQTYWPLPARLVFLAFMSGRQHGQAGRQRGRPVMTRAFLSPVWCVCQAAWAAASPPCYAANHGRGGPPNCLARDKAGAAATLKKRGNAAAVARG